MYAEMQPAPVAPQQTEGMERLDPHELGARGERAAAHSLEQRGWTLRERNWQSGYGEVDIVATDPEEGEGTAIFVEVKTRYAPGTDEVFPELAVDEQRRDRYRRAAVHYIRTHEEIDSVRFDVIAITVCGEARARLRHVSNAFGSDL